jgi:hypothetical protein
MLPIKNVNGVVGVHFVTIVVRFHVLDLRRFPSRAIVQGSNDVKPTVPSNIESPIVQYNDFGHVAYLLVGCFLFKCA